MQERDGQGARVDREFLLPLFVFQPRGFTEALDRRHERCWVDRPELAVKAVKMHLVASLALWVSSSKSSAFKRVLVVLGKRCNDQAPRLAIVDRVQSRC
jgi:hypothetical protein